MKIQEIRLLNPEIEKKRLSNLRKALCGKSRTQDVKYKISIAHKGKKLTEEHKEKLRQAKLINPVRYWLGKKRPECAENMRKIAKNQVPWNKCKKCDILSEQKKGEKHWNWKGGISSIRKRIFASREYKEWRKSVFERDNYTCQNCNAHSGNGISVYLEAHHIKPFVEYPELVFDVDNGETLCYMCHREIKHNQRSKNM